MPSKMTPRERVRAALSWNEPDRVPVMLQATPEIMQKLRDHFAPKDVLESLDVDFRGGMPKYLKALRAPQGEVTSYDIWGVGYRMVPHGSGGAYSESVELPLAKLKTMDDVEKYPWPNPDGYDYAGFAESCWRWPDHAVWLGGAGAPDIVNGVGRGRGMEQVLLDVGMRDEVGLAIIRKRCDFFFEVYRRALEAAGGRVDIVWIGEDTGNQNGRMVSPRDFNDVFRPQLQRFIDLAHRHGARAMLHSCGDTHDIMPTFIEMGLDVLDSMQPEPAGMVPETIRAACKGKLAFCGLISTQQTLPHGTVADCRREARHRLDVIAPGGGYIFSPAHCIQPDTPLENVLAIYEEATGRKFM